ncbi:MAG TPA: ribokinase [Mucilaginibacter sp.]|nr:ribokinase [Mucilaginibacter sp.]
MSSSILVIGSTNTDMVVKADRLPAPGETVIGGSFFMSQGGKGANQAVAAQRLGGNVTFIFKTGNDIFGERSIQLFKAEGINIGHCICDDQLASGVALITVDKNAENCIAVASGANAALMPADIEPVKGLIETASFVLMQLEIPIETVSYMAELAAARSCTVILNPAPACPLPASLLKNVSVITPNEKEAEVLSGISIVDDESTRKAAAIIREKGVNTVIITLGSRGAFICNAEIEQFIPAIKVEAVDTTAAGDVFNGALAVAISEGRSLEDAVRFACSAAAVSVTRLGAQTAAPYRKEVEATQFNPS